MVYNVSELYNATTISDVVMYANTATSGVLFGFFIVAIFIVMMFVLKKYDFEDALVTSSFSCFLLSGILAYGGIINIIYPLAFLALTALTGFYLYVIQKY